MSDTAYAPTVHHARREGGDPSCGTNGVVLVDTDWSTVTCKRCYKSTEWYAHHTAEQQRVAKEKALTDAAVQAAVNEVFAKARAIADRAGYCSTYQEIEQEIIADLPYTITPLKRDFEVEVEFEVTIRYTTTLTVEDQASTDDAERCITDDPEAWIEDALSVFVPDNGYVDSLDVTVESVSAA